MNNFTPRAQQVLALARKEADRFSHNYVGTEHILLGLIKLGQGVAVNVLERMGLDLDRVRMEVEKEVGTGTAGQSIGNIPYTPRVKKVLALADKEAKALNHSYVGTEHILLGLLREGDGVAARVLQGIGAALTVVWLRQALPQQHGIVGLQQVEDAAPEEVAEVPSQQAAHGRVRGRGEAFSVHDPDALRAGLEQVLQQVQEPQRAASLPLDLRGSAFQQRVWQALREIPPGQTRRYGELAEQLGSHARAVARACASNPLGLLVPCHRVVGAKGALTGYRWGVPRKQALLDQEGATLGD